MNSTKMKECFGIASFIFYLIAVLLFFYGYILPDIMMEHYILIVFSFLVLSLVYAIIGKGIFKTITLIGFAGIILFPIVALMGLF